ncbi:hypothetical protein DRP53_07060 [candidate division WOR-3 bacterium]|uniref:DUF3024 domain-containing protein n=1 Tax=candidate division WOR-3 bacterium TaxID=2052148 RepID=A0A660SGH8_UNCW3|nr:MAG: hypothetical protein DRP53_07060 [candidate division WOR-3 bacterium]
MLSKNKDDQFADVPDSSSDPMAQKAEKYLLKNMKIPEHLGITIRVTKKGGRYYVSEWRTGKQSFTGKPVEHPIARIAPIRGKGDEWQLAWMGKDLKWQNLDETYRGTFDYCLKMIIEDPGGFFWG